MKDVKTKNLVPPATAPRFREYKAKPHLREAEIDSLPRPVSMVSRVAPGKGDR